MDGLAFVKFHVDLALNHDRIINRRGAVQELGVAGFELNDAKHRAGRKFQADVLHGGVLVAGVVGGNRRARPKNPRRHVLAPWHQLFRAIDLYDRPSVAIVARDDPSYGRSYARLRGLTPIRYPFVETDCLAIRDTL